MLAPVIATLLVAAVVVLGSRPRTPVPAAAPVHATVSMADALAPALEPMLRALSGRIEALRAREAALTAPCGTPTARRTLRFRVEVERGLPESTDAFARGVLVVLCDERSWIGGGGVRVRYDPRAPVVVRLLSAASTERRCLRLTGLSVNRKYSCAGAREAVLNADRWFGGSPTWPGTVEEYRALLVNHELGHVLGLGHAGCARRGAPAPVMMQQSKGLGGCAANPWPTARELRLMR